MQGQDTGLRGRRHKLTPVIRGSHQVRAAVASRMKAMEETESQASGHPAVPACGPEVHRGVTWVLRSCPVSPNSLGPPYRFPWGLAPSLPSPPPDTYPIAFDAHVSFKPGKAVFPLHEGRERASVYTEEPPGWLTHGTRSTRSPDPGPLGRSTGAGLARCPVPCAL